MQALAAVTELASPVKAGLEFIWVISFGQLLTIIVTIGTMLLAIGKLAATVFSLNREMTAMRSDVKQMRADLSRIMGVFITAQMLKMEDREDRDDN